MKNKNVGWLILGIAAILGVIVFLFNSAMTAIVSTSCSHGPSCAMYGDIRTQTYVSLAILAIMFIIGIVLVFSKENEKVVIKRVKPYSEAKFSPKKFDKKSLENLNGDEGRIMNLLLENQGSLYQSKIAEELGMNKVKVTRVLDSLEAQNLIERKRRGMTNIVILK